MLADCSSNNGYTVTPLPISDLIKGEFHTSIGKHISNDEKAIKVCPLFYEMTYIELSLKYNIK